ncbi:ribonuclease III, partial [Candidatus Aerophobetes bacterium]|nr:ribonuclease III [Candidatus Aerophobetes bacterium]
LYRKFPHLDEGMLSRIKSAVVSQENLAYHARKIDLSRYILVSKDQDHIRFQDTTLADAYEAVIGAIYLDRGMRVTKRFVLDFFIKEENLLAKPRDFKSLLQEYSQAVYKKLPYYKLIQEKGPDHKKMFMVRVEINGKILGEGWGSSKKKAEKIAAQRAWEKINTMTQEEK